ncbi:cell adhesion molecule Dscam2-like [Uloborus diversus]|uniref:cell adhesion molecule Dscam2-like n=1 Tax=Uloborus diversus TaxID=327109 RepID=UPI002409F206|nr:cell adhesion molecule Dscam2-like [Uloborus diversus]
MITLSEIFWILSVIHLITCHELPKLNPLSLPDHHSIGSRAKLLCVASSGDQPIDFQWLKDGASFSSGKIEQLDEWTSSLTIYPLSLDHNGNYTCVASNDVGKNRVTASLFVTAPPQWVIEPADVSVKTGEKVILPCSAEGSPKVKISWKKQSKSQLSLIFSSDDFWIHENGTLSISNAQKTKSGIYVCEASNGVGNTLTKNVKLTVFEYPVVDRIVDHVTIERGHTAQLSCIASGDPPLTYIWMRNKVSLAEQPDLLERVSFSELPSQEHVQFTLSISNTKIEDEGIYTCVARNDFGSDKKEVRLMLVERPYPPRYVEMIDIWSRSARLKWSPSDNGNSPILSYTVEYWTNPGGHWNETLSSSLTSCILRGLKPFTTYSFHVWASNNVGDSEPSEQVQFTTAKEEPSAPPVDVKLEDVGSTFVRISWKPPPRDEWNGVLTGYYVGYKQSSSHHPYTYNTVDAEDDIYYVLRGLRRNTRYLITVRSFNDVGSGPMSEEIPFKTLNQEPPVQPILVVKDIGSTFLQIHWIMPDDEKLKISGYTIHYRKNGEKWKEISVPDAVQTSYTLTNLDTGVPYQIYITVHGSGGISEPSEVATVRTSAEAIFHAPPKSPAVQPAIDDVTQILYIVVPVAVATVIIVIVIVTACVYVYSKRPLPVSHPYGDLPASKNFSYMSTVPRQRDIPITVCGGNAMKYGSPYSTVPLTRPEQDEDEPIYESVMDEIRCKIKQKSLDDDVKIGSGTIV